MLQHTSLGSKLPVVKSGGCAGIYIYIYIELPDLVSSGAQGLRVVRSEKQNLPILGVWYRALQGKILRKGGVTLALLYRE